MPVLHKREPDFILDHFVLASNVIFAVLIKYFENPLTPAIPVALFGAIAR